MPIWKKMSLGPGCGCDSGQGCGAAARYSRWVSYGVLPVVTLVLFGNVELTPAVSAPRRHR